MATRKQLEQQYIEDRAFWGSVGGRWRGLASGILAGAVGGTLMGIVVAFGFGAATSTAVTSLVPAASAGTAGLGIVGIFTAAGMLVCGGLQALAGSISGGVASGIVAKKELEQDASRALDQEVALKPISPSALDKAPKLPGPNWRIMAIGGVLTAAIGAFLAYAGMLPASVGYLLLGQEMGTAMGAAAAATTLGTFGLIFGVGLRPWNRFKKWSDGIFEGRLTGRTIPSMTQLKEQLLAVNHDQPDISASPDRKQPAYADRVLQERTQAITVSPHVSV